MDLAALVGYCAASLVFLTFAMKTMIPLRIVGLASNVFFIAYGYSWQRKQREGALRAQLLTDPHSPAEYRVNGVVRNMDEWYKAFGVKPGDKMYLPPEKRVRVW